MNILKKLSILPLIAALSGCGQTSENIQKEFNGKNYSLKIASKYEKYDVPNSPIYDKNVKMIKRANENEGEEVITYDAKKVLVLEYNSQVLREMHEIDPEIEIDVPFSTINGRLLTAPYEASLVKVQGVSLTNEEDAVDAPVGFQEIEFDSLGTYGTSVGTYFSKGTKIQPKSIKTKSFDTSSGFSVARTNVYLYNDEIIPSGNSIANPKVTWLVDKDYNYIENNQGIANYETTKRSVCVTSTYEYFNEDFDKFDITCDDFELLPYDEVKHTKVSVTSKIKDFSITFDFYFKFHEESIPKE